MIRVLRTKRAVRRWLSGGAVVLGLLLLLTGIGYALDIPAISVPAAVAQIDKYQVRSELLRQAVDTLGACSPAQAAELWSTGLQQRNAALQYAALSPALRERYAAQLETTAPNWVTGFSSPWVAAYEQEREQTPAPDRRVLTYRYDLVTSSGPFDSYTAVFTVEREGDAWRIVDIDMNEELIPYTGWVDAASARQTPPETSVTVASTSSPAG